MLGVPQRLGLVVRVVVRSVVGVVNLSRAFCDPRSYQNMSAASSKLLKITLPEVQRFYFNSEEYFSSTTLESGNIFRCMGHHSNYLPSKNKYDWFIVYFV